MADSKTHTATGDHQGDPAWDTLYYVDFSTGSGAGSATLQRKIGNTWANVDGPFTSDMDSLRTSEIKPTFSPAPHRWNVTVTSGTITTYLEAGSRDPNARSG